EAYEKGRQVFIVGAQGQTARRLQDLGVLAMLPPNNVLMDRREALEQAVALVNPRVAEFNTVGSGYL
ncbi:MAG: sodium-independent anion transporter, partial [Symploca sp. SIO2D2]|nr:sodium-independent anion transporter [Symploca sp. SIO2D2]NEQ69024.1 sodium-independent anion transporter [Symploca sp. SIO2D2]